jgi:CheY-like chemotaxis protein
MRSLIKRTVADLAETIHECSDGAEALAAYNTNPPDCVLMDIKMGQMDGIAATRNIRAAYRTPRSSSLPTTMTTNCATRPSAPEPATTSSKKIY